MLMCASYFRTNGRYTLFGRSSGSSAMFKSVTGIITYFYGFKIAPRSADDFET